MKQWQSVDEVLDYAIQKEQEAHDFYRDLAGNVETPWMKETFEQFAREEMGHKKKLIKVKEGREMVSAGEKIMDLKVGDYLADVEVKDHLTYQEALILAMKREKMAFKLYTDLAASVEDAGIRNLFLGLAQEEAKHKLRFEIEYDERILTEN
jgi:rubrerythrin